MTFLDQPGSVLFWKRLSMNYLFLLVLVALRLLFFLPFLPFLLGAPRLPLLGRLPDATRAFFAACRTFVAGRYGISLDGASFWTPKYPATLIFTLPFTTRGFPFPPAPPLDRLLRGIREDAVEGTSSLTSCARDVVSNLTRGFLRDICLRQRSIVN